MALWFGLLLLGAIAAPSASAQTAPQDEAAQWEDVGQTGFGTKRLVLASACIEACPWGELGDFVKEALAPDGYEIILCRNCNRTEGPRIVARASYPPPLVEDDLRHGTVRRVRAKIDFGITEASMLVWAHAGQHIYAKDGPYPDLRLIARIEDPTYLLVAVKPELGIKSLAEVRERKLPVRIITDFQPTVMPVLEYYRLDRKSLESWGGALMPPRDITADTPFDIVISSLASPANNPESAFWTTVTVGHKLQFLDLPEDLLDRLVKDTGMVRTKARWGLLRGVDRTIPTVGRSGEVIFARTDMPDDVAYAIARAADRNRGELKWFVRPYSIDPLTVADGKGVPLHPGAARYYREKGYID
ncbi:TAXI family TRAP transporter solute-binding subunit [Sphingomonas canadensis]|uniref:TAXI family TRAP transporter solute-binding subunit n=1 Tax=Sphingomonas canadensis TaxID=1219257 RepID=UPI00222F4655|nr:TAXI family TRAP transporter solute-binding subunit [Sphingomonas canadensis]